MTDRDYELFQEFMRWRASTAGAGRSSDAPEASPTLGELWPAWAAWASQPGVMRSWRVRQYHGPLILATVIEWRGEKRAVRDLRVDELTPAFAEAFRVARTATPRRYGGGTVSANTTNNELTSVMCMLQWHVREGRIARNPIAGWKRVPEAAYRRRTKLTHDQLVEFLSHGHPMFRDIVWVAYRCLGMRNTEARELRKREVDWNERVIYLPGERTKTGLPRDVPIPDDAFELIEQHARRSRGEYVFVAPWDPRCSAPIKRATFQRWLMVCRKKSGMVGVGGERIVVHHARHAGLTDALAVAPPGYVSKHGGLSLAELEKTYNHGSVHDVRQALNRRGPQGLPGRNDASAKSRHGG